ncbi:MAG: hypothetical protein MJZ04_03645 [Bacteroidales bacterium]|nr:hypothetical protein [Bacteroidales bacterium]
MGNGLLGTNMYKAESPDTYRINVGRSDVTDEKMDLSIYDAETTGTFATDRGSIQFSTYVHALEQFEVLMNDFLKPNTLYAESGPVIETPLAGISTLHEFYLQDWGDRIRVFHGCPSTWKDVSFRNMRAAGAFLVAADRRNGRTTSITPAE